MPSLSPQQNTLLMNHIEETLRWLDTDVALALMAQDAYWPKWETPWWRMLLLYELDPNLSLPQRIVQELVDSLNKKLLHTFPILPSDLPEGIDPYGQIPCHCQLGNMGQVLAANGVDLDQALPWIRPWMLRYQLPDGGLNCDEAVYSRPHPHSSVVSTLPPAELVLKVWGDTTDGQVFLAKAAEYLIARRLNRSLLRAPAEICADWWLPCFPRFYHYDVLRGLEFLVAWSQKMKQPLPNIAIAETMERLDIWFQDPTATPRDPSKEAQTRRRNAAGLWERHPTAGRFPLLDYVTQPDIALSLLQARWLCVSALAHP